MKKLNQNGLFILCVLILSSCSIQKRRYSNGYFVNVNFRKAPSNSFKNEVVDNSERTVCLKETTNEDSLKNIKNRLAEREVIEEKVKRKIRNDSLIKQPIYSASTSQVKLDDRTLLFKNNQLKQKNKPFKITHKIKSLETMKKEKEQIKSQRKLGVIIGLSLLLMALLAGISAPILSGMFVKGNSVLTALNVTSDFSGFLTSITGWIGIFFLDIVVSIGVYNYYQKMNTKRAKLTSFFRLLYTGFLGGSIVQLLMVTLATPSLSIYSHLNSFHLFWNIGLVFFGIHLIYLGLIFTNEGGRKWFNTLVKSLLIIAGIGYVITSIGFLIAPNSLILSTILKPLFVLPMILSEVIFAIWMLVKGGKK